MITGLVGFAVLAVVLLLVVAVAREPGPTPEDVAVSYELAWDRLDFDTLWTLSTRELRDGRPRAEFIAAKRSAYAEQPKLTGLVTRVAIEEAVTGADVALVRTRLELREAPAVHDQLRLERRDGSWRVAAYDLEREPRKTRERD